MISVLALDIAPHGVGWAVGKPDIARGGRAGWGMFRPEAKPDMEHITLLHFAHFLDDIHRKHKLTHIIWEKIFINPKAFDENTKRLQFNMEGIALVFCAANKVDPSHVTVASWRTRAYGTSKAPPHFRVNQYQETKFWKETAIAWAARRGWTVDTHDEAEALGVMHYLLHALDPTYAGLTDPIFNRLQNEADMQKGPIHGR